MLTAAQSGRSLKPKIQPNVAAFRARSTRQLVWATLQNVERQGFGLLKLPKEHSPPTS